MELAHRYTVVFLLVVVVSGAVLFVTFSTHQSDVTESAEQSVESRASVASASLDNRLRDQQETISFLATNPAIVEHRTDRQRSTLDSFVETTSFNGVSVVNETGRIRALVTTDGEQTELIGEDLSNRQYVQRALAGDQYISEPIRAETENHILVISAPLVGDTEVVGTVNGAYHLNRTQLFQNLVRDDDETAVTVTAGNETLYSGAGRFSEMINGSASLKTVDWTVTVHRNQQSIDQSVDRLLLFQVALGLVLLGSLVGFGGWVYRSQIRRTSTLQDRLHALEQREYEPGPSLEGSSEWQQIDEVLDQLGETLSRREQMLLVHNRILRHNLRNKLNVIDSHAELLESKVDEEHIDDIGNIRTTTDRLLMLAERARMTVQFLDPPKEPLRADVTPIVRRRIENVEQRNPSLTIRQFLHESAYAACEGEIGTAIEELLQNVADHGGPEPTATVTVATQRNSILIRIEDAGPGIPEEEVEIVSGDQDVTQLQHMRGIGLRLVDWIVRRYDGTLSISQGTQEGTVIDIRLPRADPPEGESEGSNTAQGNQ